MNILIKYFTELKNYVTKIIVISFFLNFVWEMIQMPFYDNFSISSTTTIFCLLASIGDVIMILIIYPRFVIRKLRISNKALIFLYLQNKNIITNYIFLLHKNKSNMMFLKKSNLF